eukprot:jgi/Hompol1/2558/HPOL_005723-RA
MNDELLVEDVDMNDDGDSAHLICRDDLEYVQFLHVTVMLARLALSTAGRGHFPIKVEDSAALRLSALAPLLKLQEYDGQSPNCKYELSLRSLIVILIRHMSSKAHLTNATTDGSADAAHIEALSMPRFMARILKTMALADSQHRDELCK